MQNGAMVIESLNLVQFFETHETGTNCPHTFNADDVSRLSVCVCVCVWCCLLYTSGMKRLILLVISRAPKQYILIFKLSLSLYDHNKLWRRCDVIRLN